MPNTNTLESTSPRINAVVSASAGTGKTWLLVTRLLRLLLLGEAPSSILAVTFTEKAATEIRERLMDILRQWTHIDDAELRVELSLIDVPESQLEQAKQLYESLIYAENDIRIVTFHAFCTELLKRFPFEAEIPPGFEINSEGNDLQEEALERLYRESAEEKEQAPLRNALEILFESCAGLTNTNLALRSFLNHRNDWFAYTEGYENPPQEASRHLSEVLEIPLDHADKTVTTDKETHKAIEQHKKFIRCHPIKTHTKYAADIDNFLNSDKQVSRSNDTWEPLWSCFFTKEGTVRKQYSSEAPLQKKLSEEDRRRFQTNLDSIVARLVKFKELFLKHETLRRNDAWYLVGQRLIDIYQQLKLSHRQLDYDDLEWRACRLVKHESNAHWIQSRLSGRINHILVDEFQDTNPHQWQLLKPLLEEMASQKTGGSVFIVGDIKQSVYGFRRADPSLQKQAQKWLQQHMQGHIYTSDCSRRSAPAIVAFINSVFGSNEESSSIEFNQHDTALETPGGIDVLPFVEKPPSDREKPVWRRILKERPKTDTEHSAYHEGQQIAQRVRQMVEDRVAIYDRDATSRPLRFGDFILLLRQRTRLEHYERALLEEQIPYVSGQTDKMFGSLEIQDMLALLSLLIDNKRNLDLAQVLRSPIFSIDDEHLLALSKGKHWFTNLGLAVDDKLLCSAHELISGWIERARGHLPIHDLLSGIYHEGDLINRYRLAARDREKKLTEGNLLRLLDYSLEYESGRYPNLADFTLRLRRHITRAKEARAANSSISSNELETGEHLRIMTIHQAKGLEAPVVILADCGKPKERHSTYGVLASWPQEGDRPHHFLLTPKSADTDDLTWENYNLMRQREERENTNLLYVAVTRARQYLLISGGGEKQENSWYKRLEKHVPKSKFLAQPFCGEITKEVTTETLAETKVKELPRKPLPPAYTIETHRNLPTDPMPQGKKHKTSTHEDKKLRGTIIHLALQALSEKQTNEAISNTLVAKFPEARQWLPEYIKTAQELIDNQNLRELFDLALHEQVLNEVPISFVHDDEQYFGIVDRICVNKDAVWVVDYKTHRNPQRRIEEIKALYAEQMRVYYLGASKLWPERKIRVSLLLTETAQLCDYDFS